MRYGTVCSGIEAPSVAWGPLGWEPQWFAEIEPFPKAVLKHYYPGVPDLGDFTTADQKAFTPVDLICAGTPCQSFSVAGKRAGLDDPRGNLTLAFLALVARLRPRWVVWENVPGVLSIDGGRTFGTVLGLLGQCGYGWAWRVLDAQYWGVPQRRRRVFVVGCLGDRRRAAAVLFERDCLSGNPPPNRQAGKGVALSPTLRAGGNRTGGDRPPGTDVDTVETLVVSLARPLAGHHHRTDLDTETFVTHSLRTEGADASEDGTGRGVPLVLSNGQGDPNVGIDRAFALDTEGSQAVAFDEVARPLRAGRSIADSSGDHGDVARTGMTVRRLLPIEAERLQGCPDNYTAIRYRGKVASDSVRYRALGNSMAVPVVRWLGERIAMVAG